MSSEDDPVVDEQLVVVHFRELAHSHFDKPGDGKLILEANGEEVAFDAMMAEPPGSFLILEKGPEAVKSEGDRAAGEEEPRHGGYKVYGTTRGMIDVSVPRLSAPLAPNTSDPLASASRAPRGGGGGGQKADEAERSSTIGVAGQASRPSYMELTGATDLSAGAWPSVRFVMTVLMDRHPRLGRWLQHWPTALMALSAVLEYISISEHHASMSEHFFGLCRESVTLGEQERMSPLEKLKVKRLREQGDVLSAKQKALSVLLLSILPRFTEGLQQRTSSSHSRIALIRQVYVAVDAAYRIAYLLGISPYWSPFMHLAGIRVVRRQGSVEDSGGGFGLKYVLWSLVYAVQFGQWYMAVRPSLTSKALPGRSHAIPPPPPRPKPAPADQGGVGLPVDKRVCPVCRKRRSNPAVAAVSGYVYCYVCLVKAVRGTGKDPVTQFDMREEQILRLHEPDS